MFLSFNQKSSKNIWSDRRDLIQSHHQPPRKPKQIMYNMFYSSSTPLIFYFDHRSPKQCVVISVLSVVMVTVILTAILLGALMPWKKPSRTLPTSMIVAFVMFRFCLFLHSIVLFRRFCTYTTLE